MNKLNNLLEREKYFAVIFLIGFLIKYNYLLLHIFYVPSITGLILRNIFLISFINYFLFPLVKKKQGRVLLFTILSLFSILFIANIWYNKYFGNYLSFTDMIMGEGINPIEVLFKHIINFWEFIFMLDLFLLRFFINETKYKEYQFRSGMSSLFRKKSDPLIIILIIILLLVQIFYTNRLLGNNRMDQLYNRSAAAFVNVYGLTPLYLYEFYLSTADNEPNISYVESFSAKSETKRNDKELVEEDMNIIAIQIESLDEKLIDYKYNNKELTPFLNQLKEESLYFDNLYAQHINGSFDADFSFLTSFYPMNKNYTFENNDMTKFDSLTKILNCSGYKTLAFHGNDKKFFSRDKAFSDLGFDEFYSREDFSIQDRVFDMEESYLGMNDYDFFNQSLDYLEKADQPFFAFMITVTSHTPFDFYPSDKAEEEFMDIENSLLRDYFQSISFVDKSIEHLFAELEKRGMSEDTLFIIYSDHEAGINEEEYSSGGEFITDRNIKEPEQIPLIIKHPNVEAGVIKKTGTTTDIAPTILDILGVEKTPEDFLGSSLLKGEEKPVLFMNELPQVLYKGNLFTKEIRGSEKLDGFEKSGYFEKRREKNVELSPEEKSNVLETIAYIRATIFERVRLENR